MNEAKEGKSCESCKFNYSGITKQCILCLPENNRAHWQPLPEKPQEQESVRGWEKEFDDKFVEHVNDNQGYMELRVRRVNPNNRADSDNPVEDLKSFIRSLLKSSDELKKDIIADAYQAGYDNV